MNISLYLYIVDLVGNIDTVCFLIEILFVIFYLICAIAFIATADEYSKEEHKVVRENISRLNKKLWIPIAALTLSVFIPSKTTLYLMMGANFLQDSKLPNKVEQALELKLDDVIKTLSKKDKDKS